MTDSIVYKRNCPKCNRELVYKSGRNLQIAEEANSSCRKCRTQTKETREKISVSVKSLGQSGRNNHFFGKHHSDETKKKIKEKRALQVFSDETRNKLSESHKGKICSEESKKKISIANKGKLSWIKGKHHSEETRKKITLANIGKRRTDETKKKISVTKKQHWQNPIIRKRFYDALSKTKWIKVRSDVGQLEMIERWNLLGFNFIPNYQLHADDFLCYIDGYDKEHNVVLEYDSGYHNTSYQQKKDLIRQQKIIDILKPKKFWRYNAVKKKCDNIL